MQLVRLITSLKARRFPRVLKLFLVVFVFRTLIQWCAKLRKKYVNVIRLGKHFHTPKCVSDPVLGFLHYMATNYETMMHARADLFEQASDEAGKKVDTIQVITPIWMPEPTLLTRDPVMVKHMVQDDFNAFLKPQILKDVLSDVFKDSFIVASHGPLAPADDKIWREQRKNGSKIFTRNLFKGHVHKTLLQNTDKIKKILNNKISNGQSSKTTVKMKRLFFDFGLDMIGDVGLGVDINSLGQEEDVEFSQAFDAAIELSALRVLTPGWQYVPSIYPTEWKMKKSLEILDNFVYNIIKLRREEPEEVLHSKGDILSFIMQANPTYSDEQLRNVAVPFMTAGRDTSSTVMCFLMFILASHPEIQDKFLREVNAKIGRENRVTLDVLSTMPYTDAIVMEALRLLPPVPYDMKYCAQDSMMKSGLVIPKGTNIAYDQFAMGRDASVYKNPGRFDPTRWLGERKIGEYDHFKFPVFNGGPRVCLGKDLAMFEIKLLFCELIREFEFSLPEHLLPRNEREFRNDVTMLNGVPLYDVGIVTMYKGQLPVDVSKR